METSINLIDIISVLLRLIFSFLVGGLKFLNDNQIVEDHAKDPQP